MKSAAAHETRESWLNSLATLMAPMFAQLGAPLPSRIRIAIGFTSQGKRSTRIGECWDVSASADAHWEIYIRPDLAESPTTFAHQVAAILAHELVHAAVGVDAGHGPKFRRIALGLGLEGPMRSTTAGTKFKAAVAPLLAAVGPLPHGRLSTTRGRTTGPKKQTQRHIACECTKCGYAIRTTRKWLDAMGTPHCPQHGAMIEAGADADADAESDETTAA